MQLLQRASRSLSRKGLGGTARTAARVARSYADRRDTYIWYELDLASAPPAPPLAPHRLVRVGTPGERALFDGLQPEGQDPHGSDPEERIARGGVPWVVDAGGRPAFTCWTFLERAPISALPSGWLELPEGTACLEDSITSPDFRGQGIAPRAWDTLAQALRAEGYERLVTKVADENQPSRRAVTKAGFREVGAMEVRHNGPRVRLRLRRLDGGPSARELEERLDGQGRWALR